ncbi:MAG: hypothetical protein HZC40_15690 [Chloroflexi bacterium]|nr:hypothetical protein [Chloroflexota bacterium]
MASALSRKRARATARPESRVGDMTRAELRKMIEASVQRTLDKYLNDPDAGLELRPEMIESIQRQRAEYAAGKRGTPLDQVAKRLGLD